MFKNTKSNKPRNPYTRAKWLALASMAGLAALLNLVLDIRSENRTRDVRI